jgi:hypothetical protein
MEFHSKKSFILLFFEQMKNLEDKLKVNLVKWGKYAQLIRSKRNLTS